MGSTTVSLTEEQSAFLKKHPEIKFSALVRVFLTFYMPYYESMHAHLTPEDTDGYYMGEAVRAFINEESEKNE